MYVQYIKSFLQHLIFGQSLKKKQNEQIVNLEIGFEEECFRLKGYLKSLKSLIKSKKGDNIKKSLTLSSLC